MNPFFKVKYKPDLDEWQTRGHLTLLTASHTHPIVPNKIEQEAYVKR